MELTIHWFQSEKRYIYERVRVRMFVMHLEMEFMGSWGQAKAEIVMFP